MNGKLRILIIISAILISILIYFYFLFRLFDNVDFNSWLLRQEGECIAKYKGE